MVQERSKKRRFCSLMCGALSYSKYRKEKALKEISTGKKLCGKCKKSRPLKFFSKDKKYVGGYSSDCRWCKSDRWKKYYSDPKVKKQIATYHRELKQNYTPEEKRLKRIQYNKKRNERKQKDPSYKLSEAIRIAIRLSLKDKKSKNGRRWESLVGYNKDKLKRHLEKQFAGGMSWDNYGEWHIDHKIPKSVFNFTSPDHEDFKRCWALKNLQPMWAEENISKGAKLKKHFQPRLAL